MISVEGCPARIDPKNAANASGRSWRTPDRPGIWKNAKRSQFEFHNSFQFKDLCKNMGQLRVASEPSFWVPNWVGVPARFRRKRWAPGSRFEWKRSIDSGSVSAGNAQDAGRAF